MDCKLLRLSAHLISASIVYILNKSLTTGELAEDWKLARVTPVFKGKGSKLDESNYRPISVLPVIAMLFEKEILKQMMSYFIDNQLITIDQFAFLKHHSTITCLHRIIDEWLDCLNNGEYVMSCFFDIKKCFDTIDHKILLKILLTLWHQWARAQLVCKLSKLSKAICES